MSDRGAIELEAFDLRSLMGFDASSRTFLSVYLSGEALAGPLDALSERLSTLRMEVAERAEEAALWAEAQAALRAGEGAVAGVASVIAALKAGKARIVLIVSGVEAPGLRCRRCGAVDLPGHQRCPHCGADERFAVDLIDECVELATWSGAALEYIDGGHLPQMSGVSPGVVALLR